jgi:hypothetical protein
VVTIDPSTLTQAGLASTIQKRKQLGASYTSAISQRQRLAAAINAATKKVGSARAMQVYGSRYRAALAAEGKAKTGYTGYQGTYKQFGHDYNRLMALGRSNSNLDTVLGKLTPYDPQSAADRLTAQQALNDRLLQVKTGKDQLSEDYSKNVRLMEQDQPDRYRQLLSNFAGRGMAFSSSYGDSLGKETADFTQRRSDLDTANQRGQAAAAMDEANAQSTFQSQLAAILSNSTARLAQDAGTLGLAGQTDLPLLLELARRRLSTAATPTGG